MSVSIFFDINRYVPNLPDISHITFLMEMILFSEKMKWFIDFTNPQGESLVSNSDILKSVRLLVNGVPVDNTILPSFYNAIRKREYYWKWYEYNITSHLELKEFLNAGKYISKPNSRLTLYCEELGLIDKGTLTLSGLSMIGKGKKGLYYEFFTK